MVSLVPWGVGSVLGSAPSVDDSVFLAGSVPLVGSDTLAGDSDTMGYKTENQPLMRRICIQYFLDYFMRVLLISDNTHPAGTIQGWEQNEGRFN